MSTIKNILHVAIEEPKWYFVLTVSITILNLAISIVSNYFVYLQTAQKTELRIYTNGIISNSLQSLKYVPRKGSQYYSLFENYFAKRNEIENVMYVKDNNNYRLNENVFNLQNVAQLFKHYNGMKNIVNRYIYFINNGDTDVVITDVEIEYHVFPINKKIKNIDYYITNNSKWFGSGVNIDIPNEILIPKGEMKKIDFNIDQNVIFQGCITELIDNEDEMDYKNNIAGLTVILKFTALTTKGVKYVYGNTVLIDKCSFPVTNIMDMFENTSNHFFYSIHDKDLRDGKNK
jgi:hypothetical protein